METVEELRSICQTTAKKDVSNVYMRYFCRFFSIFVTKALIPTAVTADQVSFVMILTGVLGAVFFLFPGKLFFLIGALILQLWYILDCVDGEVARYRSYQKTRQMIKDKSESPITGGYWDYLNHYIVHGVVPLAWGYGLYRAYGSDVWLLAGYATSIFQTLLLAVHDTKARAYLSRIVKISRTNWMRLRSEPQRDERQGREKIKQWGIAKWVFVVLHYSCTFPTVMNAALICTVLALATAYDFRIFFLLYYALSSAVVFAGLAAQNLRNQNLDREFERLFETGGPSSESEKSR